MRVLLTWLGNTDLNAASTGLANERGPILNAVQSMPFDAIHVLSDYETQDTDQYIDWLKAQISLPVIRHTAKLSSPTHYEEIYREACKAIEDIKHEHTTAELTFHLSPGTPAMAAIWLLLAKTRHPARLIESSREHGIKEVHIPFALSAEFSPSAESDIKLTRLMQSMPPETPAFSAIIHRCAAMQRAVALAHRFAVHDVPVLILGESGTGKELFARAIHQASTRSSKPFVAVNCGAIPQELVDAELFGHEKGAFTGASATRIGYFESADGGTLFLDEIGELPLASQVRLLRVLQEHEITRVGATQSKTVNVRVIAATHRVLPEEIQAGRFREDLFHRLAVGVLTLPPLRQREGDLSPLIDAMLDNINTATGIEHKKLDVFARNLLLRHAWPGNIRELHNTLLRACIWATDGEITASDITESLAISAKPTTETILNIPIDQSFNLPEIMEKVARHYLERAMAQAHGNKTEAARLLGLGSYQTLSNWLQKYKATELARKLL